MPCAPSADGGARHVAVGGAPGVARELLGSAEGGAEVGRGRPRDHPPQHRPIERGAAAELGLTSLERVLHRQLEDSLPVQPPGRGLADAANRRLELAALALHLVDLALELLRHAIELAAELRELVVAGHGHRLIEATAGEPARGLEELADLLSQGAGDEHRARQRQDEEGHQETDHEQAVLRDRVVQLRGIGEDHELLGAGDPLAPPAVLVVPRLEIARPLRSRAHGGDGGGHRAPAPQHQQLLPAALANRARPVPARR